MKLLISYYGKCTIHTRAAPLLNESDNHDNLRTVSLQVSTALKDKQCLIPMTTYAQWATTARRAHVTTPSARRARTRTSWHSGRARSVSRASTATMVPSRWLTSRCTSAQKVSCYMRLCLYIIMLYTLAIFM